MADNISNENINKLNEILNKLDRNLSTYDRAKRDVGYFSDKFSSTFEKDGAEIFRRIADFSGARNEKLGGGSKFWGGMDKTATKLSMGLSKAVPYLAAFKVALDIANAGLKMYNQYQRDQMDIDKKRAELAFTKEKAITDIRMKNIELVSTIVQRKISTIGSTVNETLKNTLSVFNDKNLTATALAAATTMSKSAISFTQMDLELRLKRMQTEFDIENVRIQRDLDIVMQTEGIRQAELAQAEHLASGAAGAVGLSSVGGYASTGIDVAKMKSELRQTEATIANYAKKITQLYKQVGIEGQKMFNEAVKASMDFMQQQYSNLVSFTSDFENAFYSINEKSLAIGRSMGMSGSQLEKYQYSFATLSKAAAEFGRTEEDVQKIQDAYIKSTGRSILLSSDDMRNIMSLSTIFDVDAGTIGNALGAMHVFNVSVKSGSEMYSKMFNTAVKWGISNKKLAEGIEKSIRLAQKYNFKNGVDGAMQMAAWAEKTRFNMDSLSSTIDKIQTGNISDVIQMSARLNVLGGMAAVNSDPIGMLFDATNNPQGLAERMRNSMLGLGTWNEKRGMATFEGQQMLINQIAQGWGMSAEDARNMAQQLHKEEHMADVLKGYTEDQKEFLLNTARWNKDHWEVSRYDTNEAVNLNTTHLSEEDLKNIIPNDDTKKLVDYAKLSLDEQKQQTSIMLASKFGIVNETMGEFMQQSDARQAVISSFMVNNRELMTDGIMKTSRQMTKDLENQFKITGDTLSNTDSTITTIGGLMDSFAKDFPNKYEEMMDLLVTPENAYESIPKIYDTLTKIARKVGVDIESDEKKENGSVTLSDLISYAKKSGNKEDISNYLVENYASIKEDLRKNNLKRKDFKDFEDYMDFIGPEQNWDRVFRNMREGNVGDDKIKEAIAALGNSDKSIRLGKYFRDGVTVGSTLVGASQVVPVQDGSVYGMSSSNDMGIFAKSGGPFDTLFNGIFGKISRIEENLLGNASLNCNFGGKIELASNGQSIDILDVIKRDPILLKKLADAIVLQITASNNYGRYNSPLERKYVSVGR